MNIKLIARYVGIAVTFESGFMLLSLVISAVNGMDSSFSALLVSTLVTFLVGFFPVLFVRSTDDVSISEGFVITVLSWLLTCLFGMFPYLLWGDDFTLINAWFESVSGFTTTGATILPEVESLPKGLLFWRSSTHFIGGMGVVVFMLLVLPGMSTFRLRMYNLEMSSLSKESYKYRTRQSLRIILSVYIGLTLLSFLSLMVAGMPAFDAVNHAFSIAATGGFSCRNFSIASYDSRAIEAVTTFFTLASGLHFGLTFALVARRSFDIFKSHVTRFYLSAVGFATILMTVSQMLARNGGSSFSDALWKSLFQAVTISTSTGFATADTSVWPTFSIMVLILLSLMGACAGSTTGGLKADRVWIFLKALKTNILKQLHPNAVIPIRVGNSVIDMQVARSVTVYISLYVFLICIGALMLAVTGLDFTDSLTSSVAAMGNTGPAFGTCGSFGNYNHFTDFGKLILTAEMILGRLEIYPVLLFFNSFKK